MPKGKIEINKEKCKGCKICIAFCPKKCIGVSQNLNKKGYYSVNFEQKLDKGSCTGCTLCAVVCPDLAIEVYRD